MHKPGQYKPPPRGQQKNPRADRDEMERRVAKADEFLSKGLPPHLVVVEVVKACKTTRPAALTAVTSALAGMNDELSKNIPHMKGLVAHRLQVQITKSMMKERYGDAIRGEGELAKLLGLRAPTRVAITGDSAVKDAMAKVASNMTPAEIDRIVDEQLALEAVARAGMNGYAKHGEHDG